MERLPTSGNHVMVPDITSTVILQHWDHVVTILREYTHATTLTTSASTIKEVTWEPLATQRTLHAMLQKEDPVTVP